VYAWLVKSVDVGIDRDMNDFGGMRGVLQGSRLHKHSNIIVNSPFALT
jgi:hypothetical protein